MNLDKFKERVHSCRKCGPDYVKSAVGFGNTRKPLIFFIGMNPWVKGHEFSDGKGITILKQRLNDFGFDDFFFDNVVKCEMPGDFKPGSSHVENCLPFLILQITQFFPSNLILCGSFAAEAFGVPMQMWRTGHVLHRKYLAHVIPHFSKPLYEGKKSIELYYRRLYHLIDTCLEVNENPNCSICGEKKIATMSGPVCLRGHGGV